MYMASPPLVVKLYFQLLKVLFVFSPSASGRHLSDRYEKIKIKQLAV